MIDSYTSGEFIVKGRKYKSNIGIIGDKIKIHGHLPNYELILDDLALLVDSKPDYLIIGTGASGVIKPPQEIINSIENKA